MRRSDFSIRSPKRQDGQILVGAIGLMAVGAVLLIVLMNTGRAVNEKMKVVNAADAAAYSAATITARRLNFLAYTNRSMVSNHIAVGHSMAYLSWLQHFAKATNSATGDPTMYGLVEGVIAWQILGPITNNQWADWSSYSYDTAITDRVPQLLEDSMQLTRTYESAQTGIYDSVGTLELAAMQEVAQQYDASYQVNQATEVAGMQAYASTLGETGLSTKLSQLELDLTIDPGSADSVTYLGSAIRGFMEQRSLASYADINDAPLVQLSEQTYQGVEKTREWMNERNWEKNGIVTFRSHTDLLSFRIHNLRKTGGIESYVDAGGNLAWRATDELYIKPILGAETLAYDGSASTEDFANKLTIDGNPSSYEAFNLFYRVPPDVALNPDVNRLILSAFVSKNLKCQHTGYESQLAGADIEIIGRGLDENIHTCTPNANDATAPTVSALSRAEVYYGRPSEGFGTVTGGAELMNLYNPFWQARLVN